MMLSKVKALISDDRGELNILGAIFLAMLFIAMLVVHEVMVLHDLKEHLDDEIYRSANLAIKTAMYDSYRIDSTSKYNEEVAEAAFYKYLKENLVLDGNLCRYDEKGKLKYKVVLEKVVIDGESVRMRIKGRAYTDSTWNIFDQWQIPFDILSRNMRTDI